MQLVAECPPSFTQLTDTNSIFGVRQNAYRTVESCQAYCVSVPSCVAVDFDFNDMSCWLHTNINNLHPDNVYTQDNTNQYRISRDCVSTTTTTTTTTITTTTPLVTGTTGLLQASNNSSHSGSVRFENLIR